jgi:hypothetical protein
MENEPGSYIDTDGVITPNLDDEAMFERAQLAQQGEN